MRTSHEAAHKPSDLEAQYRGETRVADGYQYWTTSHEDEVSTDIRDKVANGELDVVETKVERQPIFGPGAGRRTAIRLASMVLIALILGLVYFVFNYFQVTASTDLDQTRRADGIVVLGAAQYNGTPSNVFQERLDHAYNLYSEGMAPRIVTTGAGAEGDLTTEGSVGYQHLLAKGVPEDDILLIPEGSNSWEQLSAAAAVLERYQADEILLVSDKSHSYRLLGIADELGMDAYVSPSAVQPSTMDHLRETAAVSIGRITGYRRLSAFTEAG